MEHARAISRADGKIDGSEIQVLKFISLSMGKNGLAMVVKFQVLQDSQNFRNKDEILG